MALWLEPLETRLTPAAITVTSSGDAIAIDGLASLREAITSINNQADVNGDVTLNRVGNYASLAGGTPDVINFSILGRGVHTIAVTGTPEPTIGRPLTINGYTQASGATQAAANTLANADNAVILIQLDGAGAGANADGLTLGAGSGGSTIKGLDITDFSGNGIVVRSNGNSIVGNFIGVNPAGSVAEPNQGDGVLISNASNDTVGGTTPDARNVVSGNAGDGVHIVGTTEQPAAGDTVEGNFVGVNAAGTGSVGTKPGGAAAGNSQAGVEISGGNGDTVGGATAAARNVVGLNAYGIEVDDGGENNVIEGNYSGVGADGVTPAGNNMQGVVLRSDDNLAPPLGPGQANEPPVSGNVIGLNPTTLAGLGNLVEFNGLGGVVVFGNPPQNNAVQAQNSGNSVLGNSIFENGRSFEKGPPPFRNASLGIDLSNQFAFPEDDSVTPNDSHGHGAPNDPNNFQNFPVLTSVTQVAGGYQIAGTLTHAASPNTTYRIEFFSNNPDPELLPPEGQTFIGAINVTTYASGTVSFAPTFNVNLSLDQNVTANATNLTPDPSAPAGSVNVFNSSEFSRELPLQFPTFTHVASSANPSIAGQPVTFTVTAASSFTTTVPTGSVVIVFNNSPFGPFTLQNGQAVFTISTLPPGPYEVQADYTPDTTAFAGSAAVMTSNQQVLPPATTSLAFGAGTNGVEALVNLNANGQAVATPTPFPGWTGEVHRAAGQFEVGVGPSSATVWAVGPGGVPAVRILDDSTGTVLASFFAFDPKFTGGVNVAVADVNGDGVPDVIVAAGPGGGPAVKVIDGTKLNQVQPNGEIADSALLASFYAFDPRFTGGVTVAATSTFIQRFRSGQTFVSPGELIVGAGPGGGPAVFVIDETKLNQTQADGEIAGSALLASFYAFDPAFTGGVNVAVAAVNGDGVTDLIIGAGPGGGPAVRVLDGNKLNQVQADGEIAPSASLHDFFAYGPGFSGGVRVGVVEQNPVTRTPAIITGAGPGGGPAVKVFEADDLALLDSFFAAAPDFTGGVFV